MTLKFSTINVIRLLRHLWQFKKMALKLIYARAKNGVIGINNKLPWHLPEDLAHFKKTTQGCAVLMGRKTWDSLPPAFRPLPGRTNIVLTRQSNWQAEGAQVVHSLPQAIDLCPKDQTLWVIGGAEIYAQALPYASEIVVTEIDIEPDGDAFAPHLNDDWREISRVTQTNEKGLTYHFVKLSHSTQGGIAYV
jgi:dihydrofolate reductase